jgi:SNF2 family DNA or RNA helicase
MKVVDEGHAMGRGKGSLAIRFASWISAQRRWAMTGTPTQQTASQNGLSNMNGLMQFLQHDFFTRRRDGDKVWQRFISRSWKDGHLSSFYRLKSLLSLLMIRHTKLDIEELQPPVYKTTIVPMSSVEIITYNTLVSAVQGNLLLTGMEGKTSGKQDSLLHRSQTKHAHLALTNIRRVCCGEARVLPSLKHEQWIEFIELCVNKHKMKAEKVQEMEEFLQRTTSEQLSRCHSCGILLSMLLVLPCGCLLCTECTDTQRSTCLMCDKPYDVDDFQLLQPGLFYEWRKSEDFDSKDDKNLGQAARTNVIAALDQNGAHGAEGSALRAHAAHNQLLLRPPAERQRSRNPNDGHVCEYSQSFDPGKCTLCFEPHQHCKLVNRDSRCQTCFAEAKDCPKAETKSHFLVQKLLRLYEAEQKRNSDFIPTSDSGQLASQRKLKVIVFSQFRQALDLVGNRLLNRFGTGCVAEYWGNYRAAELHKFVFDKDCFVLLLGKDGSEGLDLSFVTHLFFLEAIWDKSLQQQAVARAWRMGATGPVQVETLLAKSTVEEQMHKLEEARSLKNLEVDNSSSETNESTDDVQTAALLKEDYSEIQRGKIQFLLKSLKLIVGVDLVPLPHAEYVEKRFGSQEAATSTCPTEATHNEPRTKKLKRSPKQVHFAVC